MDKSYLVKEGEFNSSNKKNFKVAGNKFSGGPPPQPFCGEPAKNSQNSTRRSLLRRSNKTNRT